MTEDSLPDWERLLAAERHLQALVPGSVLVGGTAAVLHAGHRISFDGDHVLTDLTERFEQVLADLEAAAGWQTSRVRRPVLILGRLDGILTGIRQLRRVRPLETEEIAGLRVPTLSTAVEKRGFLAARPRFSLPTTSIISAGGGEGGVRDASGLPKLRDLAPDYRLASALSANLRPHQEPQKRG